MSELAEKLYTEKLNKFVDKLWVDIPCSPPDSFREIIIKDIQFADDLKKLKIEAINEAKIIEKQKKVGE